MYIILLDKDAKPYGRIKHWEMIQDYDDIITYLNRFIADGWNYKVYLQGKQISI